MTEALLAAKADPSHQDLVLGSALEIASREKPPNHRCALFVLSVCPTICAFCMLGTHAAVVAMHHRKASFCLGVRKLVKMMQAALKSSGPKQSTGSKATRMSVAKMPKSSTAIEVQFVVLLRCSYVSYSMPCAARALDVLLLRSRLRQWGPSPLLRALSI